MTTVGEVLAARSIDPAGLSRMMKWSFGVHAGVVLLAFIVPSSWISDDHAELEVMTISLGAGTPGPESGGRAAISARPVQEVAPPPPRPVPITPATAQPQTSSAAVNLPPPPDAPPAPPSPVRRPPTTGEEVRQGTSAAETGAQQAAPGLSFGGGGGEALVSADFCCPWYFEEMLARIRQQWHSDLPVRGSTVIQFTIAADGTIPLEAMRIMQTSSTTGDLEARRALGSVRLNPIPPQAQMREIVIRLTFEYGRER